MFFAIVAVLTCWLSAFPDLANAQGSQGQDAVYNSSNSVVGSNAFIDASMFGKNNTDVCAVLYGILSGTSTSYPTLGAVIDARGLPGSTGTSMTCAAGTTPWSQNGNTTIVNVPSTILLPATGSSPIQIPTTWVLPSNTRLIGEGDGIPSSPSFSPGTHIQVASGTLLTTMIQFGPSSSVCGSGGCSGISVERLTLNGKAQSVDGIINQLSQANTYVDHVTLYQILGTGLLISGSAPNSGPYTNITFDTGGYSGTSSTVCAQILSVSGGTRGIHGLRCKSETNDAPAAVLLDSSNNSIEDVTIVGFYDGILVGKNANAQSNVLINIIGDTSNPLAGMTPVNTIHISNSNTVTDLGIVGVSSGGSGTYTIEDNVTLPSGSQEISDASVGIYTIGEATGGGYSRFTTSPSVAHWTVGHAAPTTSTGCTQGSLYSCTNGLNGAVSCTSSSGTAALWVCGPSHTWVPIQ